MSVANLTDSRLKDEHEIPAPDVESVGGRARSGALWTIGMSVGRQAITVVSTAVLARFLLPSDYGMLAMVGTLTALLANISGAGLSMATVQRRNLSHAQVSNLFWINSGVGFLAWGILILAAPYLARFYGTPELVLITIVTGVSFAIGGIAVQPKALLERQMRFRSLTLIDLTNQVLSATAAIALAVAGWGYWALVVGGILAAAANLVLAFLVSGFRPSFPARNVGTKPLLSFGGFLALSSVVAYFAGTLDNILIGRVWGVEDLGFYSRAYLLMTLPVGLFTGSIGRVMFPALSALAHDTELMANAYRKALRGLVYAGLPVAIGLVITAPETIRLVYGSQWMAVVPIYSWLAVSSAINIVAGTTYWLYTATGRSKIQFWLNLAFTSVLIGLIVIGVGYGPEGVAIAVAINAMITVFPRAYIAHRIVGISFRETYWNLTSIILIAVIMGVLTIVAGTVVDAVWDQWMLTLATKVSVGVLSYALMSLLWIRPLPIPIPGKITNRFRFMKWN